MAHNHFIPSYRKHSSGQARVTLVDSVTGRRKDVLLGKYRSKESRTEYGAAIARWEAAGRRLAEDVARDLTVNELMVAYVPFVEAHYRRPDGTPTNEQNDIKYSLKPLKRLYGDARAVDFGPLSLKAVRQQMVIDGLARPVVNKRIGRVRRMFKWGVENELVAPSVLQALQAVGGLQRGRTDAREPEPIRPVAQAHVDATLPHMPPPVAALVRLQLLTGARPGELVIMRTADVNTAGRVWVFTPETHKNSHRGRGREIYIGPKAQDVLRPWLKADLAAFIFSPTDAEAERNARKRAGRKTPLYPSHVRHKAKMKRLARHRRMPKDRYTTESYARAIDRAADLAFLPPEPLAKRPDETHKQWAARLTEAELVELAAWRKANRWHPHQLRHTAATLIRREHGIELARIILGHTTAFTTEIYAETDRQQALDVIAKIG